MVWVGEPSCLIFFKTEIMAPFRHLLSPDNKFIWEEELENVFVASKQKITNLI